MTSTLVNEQGEELPARKGLFGVSGRFRLTADGQIVVKPGADNSRNPRTIAGTTRDGQIMLATIDGRMTTSVGTTMDETAAVAQALGQGGEDSGLGGRAGAHPPVPLTETGPCSVRADRSEA
ncbi:phosphodiester glycosidase family protein [Streptomyces sp. NPDC056231]|uniref:phosphodiester glycosidase family protein n=1 Tax=Streptomyces sp. NPDC056231 TaxID=3345755 RepID=UPI003AAE6B4C